MLAECARLSVSVRNGRVERRVQRKRKGKVLFAVRGEREQLAWQETVEGGGWRAEGGEAEGEDVPVLGLWAGRA